ncbi:hypothetical protein V8F33_005771 [Rhypophila sp. PSN 637]
MSAPMFPEEPRKLMANLVQIAHSLISLPFDLLLILVLVFEAIEDVTGQGQGCRGCSPASKFGFGLASGTTESTKILPDGTIEILDPDGDRDVKHNYFDNPIFALLRPTQ